MSGTQENILAAENTEQSQPTNQSGIDESQQSFEENAAIPPAEKMDMLLRGNSPNYLKREIEKLRKEAAKYRISSRAESEQRVLYQKKSEEIESELQTLKKSHYNLKVMRALDKAGCIKSELVAKDMPDNCEDLDKFIETYKEENKFLFKAPKQNIGTSFKSSGAKNLTSAQKMDAYIRAALGR